MVTQLSWKHFLSWSGMGQGGPWLSAEACSGTPSDVVLAFLSPTNVPVF